MTSFVTPMCFTCAHYHDNVEAEMTCNAFPAGIPDAIQTSAADHRLPFPGDNGIQYAHDEATPDYDFSHLEQEESSSIPP